MSVFWDLTESNAVHFALFYLGNDDILFCNSCNFVRCDGFAVLFEKVAAIEKMHEERYRQLLANVEGGLVFSRDEDMMWECSNCGHVVIGKNAPELCPVCKHAKSYFMIHPTNY